jgi:Plasmid pRiA4b ORF-3-like protein
VASVAVVAPASAVAGWPPADGPVTPRVLRLRVTLLDARPPIWRLLEVDADLPLDAVHRVLQVAFGWRDEHLHAFDSQDRRRRLRSLDDRPRRYLEQSLIEDPIGDPIEEEVDERACTLHQLLTEHGGPAFYEYDFGDGWYHRLEWVEELEARPCGPRARVVRARGLPAMENSGGPYGWADLREAFGSTGHPDHRAAVETLRRQAPWRPAVSGEVDLEHLNRELAALFQDAPSTGSAAIDAVVAEMADGILPEFRARVRDAGLDEPATVESATAERMTAPYRWLLECATADGGIRLTAAGRLPPAVVASGMRQLGWDARWRGPVNREEPGSPVAELRASAQALGVLRLVRGVLLPTRAAAAAQDDSLALWRFLAGRILLRRSTAPQRLAATLLLVEVAAGDRRTDDTYAPAIAFGLAACGWAQEGGWPADDVTVERLVRPTWSDLERLGAFQVGSNRVVVGVRPEGRALARLALQTTRVREG